uniref:Uncharacterized protein n=1 Tax=Anguilla anguilla TaxID=7936 RepID=A0A0E9TH09_ANGAN
MDKMLNSLTVLYGGDVRIKTLVELKQKKKKKT